MYEHPESIPFSQDVYAMGRALEKFHHPEDARKCFRLAIRGKTAADASAALAHSYRRAGDREQAAKIWRQMIASGRGGVQPYIELAQYQEHVLRDDRGALETTERAILMLGEAALREDGAVQETQNELQYRRRRLKSRLGKE